MNRDKLPELLEQVTEVIKEAAELFFADEKRGHIKTKSPADFVTEVDTSVQKFLQDKLGALLPEAQFMGEEKDNTDIDYNGLVWINDPVDGTTNLIHNFQHSVISLALEQAGELIMGLVYDPYKNELFTAIKGQGAYCNGKAIHVTDRENLSDCLVSVGTAPGNRKYAKKSFELMYEMFDRCHGIRRLGTAAMDLCYIASGRLDIYTEAYLNPWDIAAGVLIVREAGGVVTDNHGNDINVFTQTSLLAANPNIIDSAVDVISKYFE